jgi:hypothetical protein
MAVEAGCDRVAVFGFFEESFEAPDWAWNEVGFNSAGHYYSGR